MLETSVLRSWIDDVSTAQLLDAAEAIEGWVTHNIEQQSAWYTDEAKHRVVDDFRSFHLFGRGLEFSVEKGEALPFALPLFGLLVLPHRRSVRSCRHR